MEKYGFTGVEGFYSILLKTIIVAGKRKSQKSDYKFCIRAKIQEDETIVHELLHYAYVAEGRTSVSSEMREEFAYGYSIGYLRRKYTDEEIIEFNFLPYLFSLAYPLAIPKIVSENGFTQQQFKEMSHFQKYDFYRKNEKKIYELAKDMAMERGRKLIQLYSKILTQDTVSKDHGGKISRFEILDI
jgi:hypothetical protein